MAKDIPWMSERYAELTSLNLQWEPPTLESASEAECIVDGQRLIMLSANNYLNLTTHPKVVAAMVEATKLYGAGSGSVRALSGTMSIHLEAEAKVAEFKGVEASLIYSSGYSANVGLIPTLVRGKDDVIISDQLNHGSIIDGVRLTKASRAVYPHNDMAALDQVLRDHSKSERYAELTSLNLQWEPPTLESASEAECIVDGQRLIMLSANNYLNLTTHPKVVAAMVEATKLYVA